MKIQKQLNEKLVIAVKFGELDLVKALIAEGADPYYCPEDELNTFCLAVDRNELEIVSFLLKEQLITDPRVIGQALIVTNSEKMLMLLAKYNPDCEVTNDCGLKPFEVMIRHGNYSLLETYINCLLPVPEQNPKVLKWVKGNFDLKAWALYAGKNIPELYFKKAQAIRDDILLNKPKRSAAFKRLLIEVEHASDNKKIV